MASFSRFAQALLLSLFGAIFAQPLSGQTATCPPLILSGVVTDAAGGVVPAAMIVNRSRHPEGFFVDHRGAFTLEACPGDTLSIGSVGFHTVERVMPGGLDSLDLVIRLQRLQFDLRTAEVVAPRDLREIIRDIETLGYNEKDYRVSSVDALQSPITFLYQMLSREEQSKREVAMLENRDRRHALLRELFAKYVDYDIIHLADSDFQAFIEFSDPGDDLLQTWSQYEFILYIKQRFDRFQGLPTRLDDADYQYQLD